MLYTTLYHYPHAYTHTQESFSQIVGLSYYTRTKSGKNSHKRGKFYTYSQEYLCTQDTYALYTEYLIEIA